MENLHKIRIIVRITLIVIAISVFFFKKLQKSNAISDSKKSIIITTIISLALLLSLFLIGFWPPSDKEIAMLDAGGGGGGMEINFGDSDQGRGDNYKSEVLDVKDNSKQITAAATPQEDIITQDNNDDNVDATVSKPTKPTKQKTITKPETKPVTETKPKVNNNANDALANILGGKNKGGDGDDKIGGNKGKANGSMGSNGYYGNGGSGTGSGGGNGSGSGLGSGSGSGSGNGSGNGNGSGYSLGNRKALTKPAPNYICNEEGVVVVQISVDRNGIVVDAKPGARGTTNAANCLLTEAKKAAMATKWQPSVDALERQVGTIKYNFSIRD